MEGLKLLGLGTPVLDLFAEVDAAFLKKWGLTAGSTNFVAYEKLQTLKQALGPMLFLEQAGDNARNVCDAFARLEKTAGVARPAVAYSGAVGRDETARMIRRSLHEAGVRALLDEMPGQTGEIICLITPDKQRTFAAHLGVGEEFWGGVEFPEANFFFVTSISALCEKPIARAAGLRMDRCVNENRPLAISLESPKMLGGMRAEALKLAQRADLLFFNEDEMKALGLSEEEAGRLAELVFIKKGARGSSVYEGGQKAADVKAARVEKVVDTTGAGDAYAAGALWALSRGQNAAGAARAGSALAGTAIGTVGSRLPSRLALPTKA